MLFSANLGFLWTDRSLPDAVYAAKKAGFDAVECHWPYETDPTLLKQALQDTNLPILGLNTHRGDLTAGENGLSAVPGREQEARDAIDQSIEYARRIGCQAVHVMAGYTQHQQAESTFIANLTYACSQAATHQIGILIEPLNPYDAPGYFLNDMTRARRIIDTIGQESLKLMFDCYHMQILHGDITRRLKDVFDMVGHIQFASVPDRGAPDTGEINYPYLFSVIKDLGYQAPVGAEYKPIGGNTDASLGWLSQAQSV